MISNPRTFSVFVNPHDQGEASGNPTVIYELSDLSSSSTLIELAYQHPGIDVGFFKRGAEQIMLRWFNGEHEIQFCGHATLALAWWLNKTHSKSLPFHSAFDTFDAVSQHGKVWLTAPTLTPERQTSTAFDISALKVQPITRYFEQSTKTLLIECGSKTEVAAWIPDFELLNSWSRDSIGALILFSRADDSYQGYLRYFAPWYGKNEDTATGSAMRLLFPLIEKPESNEAQMVKQLSPKGGVITVMRYDASSILFTGEVVDRTPI